MKVRDLMRRDLSSVDHQTSVGATVRLLENSGLSALPVVDDEGRVVGIISEQDIIRAILPEYVGMLPSSSFLPGLNQLARRFEEIKDLPVDRFMSKEVVTCHPDDADLHAADVLLRRGWRQIPVVDEKGRLVGAVRRIDILANLRWTS